MIKDKNYDLITKYYKTDVKHIYIFIAGQD